MAKQLDPKNKFGQIDLYKAPKKSSLSETLGGMALAVVVVTVLVNIFG